MPWIPSAGSILHNDLETKPQSIVISFVDSEPTEFPILRYSFETVPKVLPANIRITKSAAGVSLKGYPNMKGLITDDAASLTEKPTFISFKGAKPVGRTSFDAPKRDATFILRVKAERISSSVAPHTAEFVVRVLRALNAPDPDPDLDLDPELNGG